jgi:hypothetical protein
MNLKTLILVFLACFTIPSVRPSNVWLSVGSMTVTRAYHTGTYIIQDNSVLIAGGNNGGTIVSSVDKYISSTGCFQSMRNMPTTRFMHTADQLSSLAGYVLIAGGYDDANAAIGVADLYHPITADILTVSLTLARYRHTSTIMSSSQLVLIGGFTTGGVIVNSSDMIDTGSNSLFVSGINTMNEPHTYHTSTLLGNTSDLALIAGGYSPITGYLSSAYLYQGSSNSFISLGSGVTMSPVRGSHTATYLPSPIDKVLITGGRGSSIYGTMFLFDVASLTFTTLTNTLIYRRYVHTATLLPNGKILIVGGYNGTALGICELIDPSNNYTVTAADNLTTGRYYHTTTLIPDSNNGTVLVCGGYNSAGAIINSCELYFV